MGEFPEPIQIFALTVVEMLMERTLADYDPEIRLKRFEVLNNIAKVEVAIDQLRQSDIRDKTAFAVWVTMQKRPLST